MNVYIQDLIDRGLLEFKYEDGMAVLYPTKEGSELHAKVLEDVKAMNDRASAAWNERL